MIKPLLVCLLAASASAAVFDVKTYGAKGDGQSQDRDSINKAIEAASAAGGGTVEFGPGTYISGSIRLRSNITLRLEPGTVIEASSDAKEYDAAEPNASDKFQDFGHSHWHNSLIWGENVSNIAIVGAGLISGKALVRERGGGGDKAIALKLCHNVTLRDFSILNGGHFGILTTGVDNLTIDNLKIDTNRDGMDIDSTSNVRITNTSVNAPNDDAIVFKGSHALGYARVSENVMISDCLVSGFEVGSLLDATYKRTVEKSPDRDGPTGRIKIGTESEGDFRNFAISNVTFDRSRGLALESVDGSHIEDIAVSNITMRDVSNGPFFIRIGSRMRAPEGVAIGTIKRVNISNVVVYNADPRFASMIAGIPGHEVEDVKFSNIRIVAKGGFSLDEAAKQPAEMVNTFFSRQIGGMPARTDPMAVPEQEKGYPEPSIFGILPAWGFFIRHAKGIELDGIDLSTIQPDKRPAFVLIDTQDFVLRNSKPVADMKLDSVTGVKSF